jgi:hypothetical protein
MNQKASNAYLLADPQHTSLRCETVNDQFVITLPAAPTDPSVSVVVLENGVAAPKPGS